MTKTDPLGAEQVFLHDQMDDESLVAIIFFDREYVSFMADEDTILNQWAYWAVYYKCSCAPMLLRMGGCKMFLFCPLDSKTKRTTLHWIYIYGMETREIQVKSQCTMVDSNLSVVSMHPPMFDAYGFTPMMYCSTLDDVRHDFPLEVLATVANHLERDRFVFLDATLPISYAQSGDYINRIIQELVDLDHW